MTHDNRTDGKYTVDAWGDVEHCVYHALVDAPEALATHRLSHFVSQLAAKMVKKGVLSVQDVELFLHSCRG